MDLDDTLLDDAAAVSKALEVFLANYPQFCRNGPFTEVLKQWRGISACQWKRFQCGEIDFQMQRRERMRAFLEKPLTDALADQYFAVYLQAYEQAWKPVEGCLEFLSQTVILPKVIITNGERRQVHKKLQQLGIAEFFNGIVTPADCGASKPDPGIFKAGLVLLGVDARNCVMVGDDRQMDLVPASQLGMQTLHVGKKGNSFWDVPSLLCLKP